MVHNGSTIVGVHLDNLLAVLFPLVSQATYHMRMHAVVYKMPKQSTIIHNGFISPLTSVLINMNSRKRSIGITVINASLMYNILEWHKYPAFLEIRKHTLSFCAKLHSVYSQCILPTVTALTFQFRG